MAVRYAPCHTALTRVTILDRGSKQVLVIIELFLDLMAFGVIE